MRIESKEKKLTFRRAYWQLVAALSLNLLGMLPVMYFTTGRLPWVVVEMFFLMEVFVFPASHLIAGLLMWMELKRVKPLHWQVSPAQVEVYRGEKLLLSLPWHDVVKVQFRRNVMALKVHRWLPGMFCLKRITKEEYEQVEATRRVAEPYAKGA